MKKGTPQKKETFQDNFIKKYCCSTHNHPQGFAWWTKKARKDFRHALRKEINNEN